MIFKQIIRFLSISLLFLSSSVAVNSNELVGESFVSNQVSVTLIKNMHPLHNVWSMWKNKYNRKYESSEEESVRFDNFIANHKLIKEHKATTYKLKLNQFADLSRSEYLSRFNPYKIDNFGKGIKFEPTCDMIENAPESIDWRQASLNPKKIKAVNGIKNQQQCGSCWAFSAVASIEGAWAVAGNQLVSLSEQELVDCSQSYGNQGCNGGLMDDAFQFVIANGGICSESAYPYQAADGTCQSQSCTSVAKISTFHDVQTMNETAIFAALQIGPISIAIEADQESFQFYSGGVYSDPSCGTNLDHGVNLVGYGTDSSSNQNYWILRNSWGQTWGEAGYMRILRGQNICGLATVPSFPSV